MRWCLVADPIIVAREQRERANALERCQFCASYADTAVDQENENRNFQCGLTGPQWNGNRSAHLNWCIGLEHIGVSKGMLIPKHIRGRSNSTIASAKDTPTRPSGPLPKTETEIVS